MAMRVVRVVVCLMIIAMDVAAGILAIEAQAAQDKVTKRSRQGNHTACEQLLISGCSGRAFKLSLLAAMLLALAHIMSNLLGGSMCLCSMEELERSSRNRKVWFICLVSSWVVAAVGLPMLIIGMLENSKLRSNGGGYHCPTSPRQQHSLSVGGVLCFIHALLSLSFYCSSVVSFPKLTTTGHALEDDR